MQLSISKPETIYTFRKFITEKAFPQSSVIIIWWQVPLFMCKWKISNWIQKDRHCRYNL